VSASLTFQARPGISIGSFYTFNSAIAGVALTGAQSPRSPSSIRRRSITIT